SATLQTPFIEGDILRYICSERKINLRLLHNSKFNLDAICTYQSFEFLPQPLTVILAAVLVFFKACAG
ncbi:MAG: hypothetical protein RSB22_14965, partial [Acinetobacter sp.]